MSSTIFFFFFIPLLAFILLAVNLIFAPHNPYQEKDSAFECGFSSFLGQNRTQFSISFFIFALLFLLFDLEILLVYPYLVSAYTNGVYGLSVMLIFLLALTLGFAFELGKKALSFDSRQISNSRVKQSSNAGVLGGYTFIPANKGRRSYSSSNYNKAIDYSISLHSKRKTTNFISINVRYFSTSTLKLKLDSSKHTNDNNLPSGVNTIIAREYYYERVYGRNQEEVRNISEQLRTSDELGYLRDRLDQVNSDIDALTNIHHDMQTRNQHHFNADTVREAIVDRVMELEADNTFNGTNVQANNHNGGTNNQNNGIGDGNSNGSSHHNERNDDGNNNAGNNGGNNSNNGTGDNGNGNALLTSPTELVQEIQESEPMDFIDPDL